MLNGRSIEARAPPSKAVQIIYLDQNKWIALARAAKYPKENSDNRAILELLCSKKKSNQIKLPLTSTNIYETHKINNTERRFDLAYCQVTLSDSTVFRGRHKRLEVEIIDSIRDVYNLSRNEREEDWFLSDVFYESTTEWNDSRLGNLVSEEFVNFIRKDPKASLFRYWMETPEPVRTAAIFNFSKGSDELRKRIEARRQLHAAESRSMRRNIQNALLMIDEIDLIESFIRRAEIPETDMNHVLSKHGRTLMENTPIYVIERELALRLEGQSNRLIHQNDLRDMQSFTAAIAYSDIIVAENQFCSLAQQAGLDRRFNTQITSDLLQLGDYLACN